ncbi:tyrosine protein phosphatase yvh1 [Rhodotorula kratochvilovae]
MDAPMQQVLPGLWIGDYIAASNHALLEEHGIACVVSSMRQEYDTAPGVNLHHVAVDDTDRTNILEHLLPTAEFIHTALENGRNVLVHCQAGVSRSTTLVAGYLMLKRGLNVEQALDKIRAARPQVEPSESFLMQLEMFERCNCEWDPVKYPEERRFLMSFAQAQMMEGASPSMVLAYYPSPAVTPKDRHGSFNLTMSSRPNEQVSPPVSPRFPNDTAIISSPTSPTAPSKDQVPPLPLAAPLPTLSAPPMRKRLTPRKNESEEDVPARLVERPEIEKIGTKEQVVVSGRRVRCKMCRRELAAREHIVAHEPGKGQQAFAPNRRDMTAYRAEVEKRRLDELQRLQSGGAASAQPAAPAVLSVQAASPGEAQQLSNPLAALRISQPLSGMRVVQPRGPPVLRPQPVARPPPRNAAPAPSSDVAAPPTSTDSTPQPPPEKDASLFPSAAPPVSSPAPAPPPSARAVDPPLLPSHTCSSYFVEPLSWMSTILETGVLAGKIVCPNKRCGAKLGNFDWAGSQCSCGAWVCPGFALNVSRVDEVSG